MRRLCFIMFGLISISAIAGGNEKKHKTSLDEMNLHGKVKMLKVIEHKGAEGKGAGDSTQEITTTWFDTRGNKTKEEYDVPGTDPILIITVYKYDKNGFLVRKIRSVGDTTLYSNNAGGNCIEEEQKDGKGGIQYRHKMEYNKNGNLVKIRMWPDTNEAHVYTYNDSAILVKKQIFNGGDVISTETYKSANEQLKTTMFYEYSDNEYKGKNICTYDDKGNRTNYTEFTADGKVKIKWSDEYVYDSKGNISKETSYKNGHVFNYATYVIEYYK